MPATSAAALKWKRDRARERVREWKKENPAKVREQKKRYYAKNNDKKRDMLRQWRKKNPELLRAQRRRHRERKAWPRILWTRQRKDSYDPEEILRGLFGVRVVLTDCRRPLPSPPPAPSPGTRQKKDSYDPEEILRGLFGVRVVSTDCRRPLPSPPPPLPPPPPPQSPSPPQPPPLRSSLTLRQMRNCQKNWISC